MNTINCVNNKNINWVNNKNINLELINQKINNCLQTKHFTNNGKNVIELKKKYIIYLIWMNQKVFY